MIGAVTRYLECGCRVSQTTSTSIAYKPSASSQSDSKTKFSQWFTVNFDANSWMNQSAVTERTKCTKWILQNDNNDAFGCRHLCNKLYIEYAYSHITMSRRWIALRLDFLFCVKATNGFGPYVSRNQVMPHNNQVRLWWHYGRCLGSLCLYLYDTQCSRVGLLFRSHIKCASNWCSVCTNSVRERCSVLVNTNCLQCYSIFRWTGTHTHTQTLETSKTI